jgi:hypothetical protein
MGSGDMLLAPHRQVRRSHRSIHCWHGHAARRSASTARAVSARTETTIGGIPAMRVDVSDGSNCDLPTQMDHVRFGPNIGSGGAARCANDVVKFSLFSRVCRHTARRACSAASASRANVCEITASISAALRGARDDRSRPAQARAPWLVLLDDRHHVQ